MTVPELLLRLLFDQPQQLRLLHLGGQRQQALDQTVVFLHCQPPLAQEVELLLCLQVVDNDVAEEPGGAVERAGVVVPDAQIAQVGQRLLGGHDERVDAARSEGTSVWIVHATNARVVRVAAQDEADVGVGGGVGTAACEHDEFVEVGVAGVVVGQESQAYSLLVVVVFVAGVDGEQDEEAGGGDESYVDGHVGEEVGFGEDCGEVDGWRKDGEAAGKAGQVCGDAEKGAKRLLSV